MSKIKDILDKMKTQGTPYYDLNLLIAKRIWLIVATLFYLSYLFTVGGFYFGPFSIDMMSKITFHLYSVFVIATAWMIYSIGEYMVAVYAPTKKGLLAIPAILAVGLIASALVIHLGFF